MNAATPTDQPLTCGSAARLPERLVLDALRLAPEPYGEPEDSRVERRLHCTREAHTGSDHHALVRELDGVHTGAVWTHWPDGGRPVAVVVVPDCLAVVTAETGSTACAGFRGHPGAHSWELSPGPHSSELSPLGPAAGHA